MSLRRPHDQRQRKRRRRSPRYDRRVRHGAVETKRRVGARAAAVGAAIVAALWSLSPPAGATNVPPGRIVSLIPSDDEVSQFVGLPVRHQDDPLPVRPRDADHLDQRDECRVLFYTNTVDVWSSEYAAFRSQIWTYPPDPDRMYVSQSVGTFGSTQDARDRFNAVYNPGIFSTCSHAQVHGPPMNPGVTMELYDFKINDDVMIWTLAGKYYGQYNGYNYVIVAWHLANVMSLSSVGEVGNPAQAVKRLTDHILDRVG
jgi:hypothetical protein